MLTPAVVCPRRTAGFYRPQLRHAAMRQRRLVREGTSTTGAVPVIIGRLMPPRPPMSIREVRAGFRDDPAARAAAVWYWLRACRSQPTRDAYQGDIGRWFAWCDSRELPASDADRADVDAWCAQLTSEGRASSTIARRLTAVSSFYRFWLDEGAIARNPAADATRPRPAGRAGDRTTRCIRHRGRARATGRRGS